MDKKNVILGSIFLIASLGMMVWSGRQDADRQRELARQAVIERAERAEAADAPLDDLASDDAPPPLVRSAAIVPAEEAGADPLVRSVRESLAPAVEEDTAVLQNDYIRALLSSRGATIKTIALIERDQGELVYPIDLESDQPVALHALAKTPPMTIAQLYNGRFVPLPVPFALVESTRNRVVFEAELEGGLQLRRTFKLVDGEHDTPENYTIRQEFTLVNPTAAAIQLDHLYINIGTAAPTNADPYGMDLNASYLENGSYHNIKATKFKAGTFSEASTRIERTGLIQWGAVKNQFFASIATPQTPASGITAVPVAYPTPVDAKKESVGISAYLEFDLPEIAPGASATLVIDLFSGPKDFTRLKKMGLQQEDVMHFGWFLGMFVGVVSWVGKSLFWLLSTLHGFTGNWGIAIILMTLVVRLFLWPLTAKAARSSKRMQELQKPMAELKEKYKDNPQKQQQATLELFKKHKINPLSSCWPVLLQFPIFIAMFNLLRNTADLRFADFLWIADLSMPDRSISLGDVALPFIGNAINVLPFVWLASMWFQMKMMPQPSVDNSQTKIIKYMPFLFFPMTYFFSSGLILYWTTTNCFSIFQGWMTRRSKDSEDIAIEEEIAESEKKKSLLKTTPIGSKKRKKK